MKTRLVRVGNSRGVRLPKTMIAEAGLNDEVELTVRDGAVVISRGTSIRSGWSEAAKQMRKCDDDQLLDAPTATRFDEKEWEW